MLMIKPHQNRKGFTLIELIVVVSIIAILAAIAIPSFIGLQKKATNASINSNAVTISSTVAVFNASNPTAQICVKPTTLALFNTAVGTSFAIQMDAADYVTAAKQLVFGGTVTGGTIVITKLT